ncbi:ABC transporter ATP-binding protein [Longirhabdus pacifica]|uniref:ABC transporter ATP-binding protein n=1 Tax=Longirhabdus pacifica TaxID=2305227 RepID=UPI001008EE3F|nr:ABC transporter ATP-binding protein [Longirhabdus pacifica]
MLDSIKLYLKIIPYIHARVKLTTVAYVSLMIQLVLRMLQPLIYAKVIDDVLIQRQTDMLLPLITWSFGLALLSFIFSLVHAIIFRYLGIKQTLDIRDVLMKKIRKIDINEIEKEGAGKFSALLGMDTATLGNFMNHVMVQMVSLSLQFIIALVILFQLDWQLGIVACICIPILFFIPRLYKKPLKKHIDHVRTHNEEIGTRLIENIDGSKEIKAYGLEEWEEQRNDNMYKGLVKSSTKEAMFRALTQQQSSLFISLFIVIVYWIGSQQVMAEVLTVGAMVAAITYLQQSFQPILGMNQFFGQLQQSEVALKRIMDFIHKPNDILSLAERMDADYVVEQDHAPAIQLQDLCVTYEKTHILHSLHVRIPKGDTVAFVGRSGSGKSTLFRTILGFMTKEGELRIHGNEIEQLTRQYLNEKISVVFQETFLFKGTLLENINIGRLKATEEEVLEAAQKANLTSLIEQLPDGLHTVIDNNGFQLSGGQRQRVAIARAFLKMPEILILDEPTSSLDRLTENEVMEALKQLMHGKTTLISTHRLDTIMDADNIVVMDKGRIITEGKHEHVLATSPLYASMVNEFQHKQHKHSMGN